MSNPIVTFKARDNPTHSDQTPLSLDIKNKLGSFNDVRTCFMRPGSTKTSELAVLVDLSILLSKVPDPDHHHSGLQYKRQSKRKSGE